MRTATFPTADNVFTFGDQICGAPEVQIRKSLPEIRHEGLDVLAAAPRFVKGVLQQHAGSGQLVDDAPVTGLTPEISKPAANDCFVVLFDGHEVFLSFQKNE